MPIQNKITLKSYFNTGDQPTESNFEDLIDSMLLVSDQDWSDLTNTPTTIDGYGITDAVSISGTQTLINKTLTSPAITSPTGLVKADVGLGNVDNTSDADKNSATATLTNKTLTSPKINVGSDAIGDLYYRDASGNLVRLSIGTSGQVLKGGTVPSYSSIASVLGYTPVNVAGDTMTGPLILDSDPSNALEAVTKSYVDNLITGLTWKQSVVAATTANITLSGTQTIDGIAVIAGDRVLVKNQTNATQNGIYVVATGAWSRTLDNDSGPEIANTTVLCESGTVNAGTQWNCSNSSVTIGSTNINFAMIAGAGVYANGIGLQLTGNVFSIDSTVATLTGTQTLTNKTLTSPVINTPTGIVKADVGLGNVDNTSDATKNSATATLTNKTLTSPVINTPTGIVKADVGLGNVDNTSDATKNSATATLTNKTLTSPKINVGSDATGDLYYRNSSGNFVRLPVGTASQILKGGTTPAYSNVWDSWLIVTSTQSLNTSKFNLETNDDLKLKIRYSAVLKTVEVVGNLIFKDATLTANGFVGVFTLPTGYRPLRTSYFPVAKENPGGVRETLINVLVDTTGGVTLINDSSQASYNGEHYYFNFRFTVD